MVSDRPSPAASVALVGAGPTGASLLERIAANVRELGVRELVVHMIDPYPPGPGRVWRQEQSPLLWMNSMPEDVTMFTDGSVVCEGPIRPGPTLAEWIARARDGDPDIPVPAGLREEIELAAPTGFPTRRLQSAYLDWFFQTVVAGLPDGVWVEVHEATVVDIVGERDGPQALHLAERSEPLVVDLVVLALGHLDVDPVPDEATLAAFAREHDLRFVPTAYTADLDLSTIEPGENVLVRGFGLAFIDLMVLLTEGRGGRFGAGTDGRLDYHPSGKEPTLYVGSRRGVPYHAKPEYRLRAAPAVLPRFFGPDQVTELTERPGELDFLRDLWPLMAKDIGWGYYTELFTGHPERVRLPFEVFSARYAEAGWDSEAMRALVAEAVPAEEDRLDLARLDQPLRGRTFADAKEFTAYLHDYIEADLERRASQEYSADLGAFLALLAVFGQLGRVLATEKLLPASQLDDVDGWWFGFFSYFASGPPGPRLRQLLALSRAGVVRFIGPDIWVRADDHRGRFLAGSPAVPGVIEATALVEARLPEPSVTRAASPLVKTLYRRRALTEELLRRGDTELSTGRILVSQDAEVVDPTGRPHPRILALGAHTSVRTAGAFSRPGTNAIAFRRSDSVARHILRQLADWERGQT